MASNKGSKRVSMKSRCVGPSLSQPRASSRQLCKWLGMPAAAVPKEAWLPWSRGAPGQSGSAAS